MRVRFSDAVSGGSTLGDTFNSNVGVAVAWTEMRLDSLAVPVGTRSIELNLSVQRPFGSYNDGGFDDVTGSMTVVPEPTSLTVWSVIGIGGIGFGARRRRRKVA